MSKIDSSANKLAAKLLNLPKTKTNLEIMTLARYYSQENAMDTIAIDCVLFGFDPNAKKLKILLLQHSVEGVSIWALPGGNVRIDESLDSAPRRILKEMANIENRVYLEQIPARSDEGRDPSRQMITIPYYALVYSGDHELTIEDPQQPGASWQDLEEIRSLPFDQMEIVQEALAALRRKIKLEPIGFELLPEKFSLRYIQNLYESVLGVELDNRNFRRKILKMDILDKLEEKQEGVAHRSAVLYSFNKENYQLLRSKGLVFDM